MVAPRRTPGSRIQIVKFPTYCVHELPVVASTAVSQIPSRFLQYTQQPQTPEMQCTEASLVAPPEGHLKEPAPYLEEWTNHRAAWTSPARLGSGGTDPVQLCPGGRCVSAAAHHVSWLGSETVQREEEAAAACSGRVTKETRAGPKLKACPSLNPLPARQGRERACHSRQ